MSTLQTLVKIQAELKAPKTQTNKFGGYTYRSCEDILEAVKPINAKYGATVLITDEIVSIGTSLEKMADGSISEHTKNYVKATARFITDEGEFSVSAFAREAEDKKGMDDSQITGSTSSYARKYALNGLYDIDDNKDSDDTNDHGKGGNNSPKTDKPKIDINKPVIIQPTPQPKPTPVVAPPVDTDSLPFPELEPNQKKVSKEKLDYMTGVIRTLSTERVMKFNEWLERVYGVKSVLDLTDSQATMVISQLTKPTNK